MQEKVKCGLQNDKEIVEVLDRTENKMEIFEVFFYFPPSWVDMLFSLLKRTIILDSMFFTATLGFFFQKYLASYKYGDYSASSSLQE